METNRVDSALILFSMWTESIRHVAEFGKGNVLFLDGSPEGMQKQFLDLMALQQLHVNQQESRLPPPPMPPADGS